MANVNYETGQIKSAVYGEEVRDAIISAIQKVATEGTNLSALVDEIESELTQRINLNTANISLKGDNLYFNEEEKLLYLMSDGQVIGDGIAVSTGGGGGGGGGGQSMYFYKPTLTNNLPDRNITATSGATVELRFTYSSVDDSGADDGPGVGRIVVGGVAKRSFRAIQGVNTVDITDILAPGTSSVSVKVENSEGTIRSLNYTVTIVTLTLTTSSDEISEYNGAGTIYYTVTGSGEKLVHFILDGTEIGTETVITSGRSRSYVVDPQSHGSHILEIYAETTVDNLNLRSDTLRLCMYWVTSTTPVIATTFNQTEATEGDTISIPYAVYDPTSEPASVTLSVIDSNSEVYSTKTINKGRTANDPWIINDYPSGSVIFRITCGNTVKNLPVTVEPYNFPISKVTDSLLLEFTPDGRANTESNPASWSYGNDISATFAGFSWSQSDGWLYDEENAAILRFLPGDTMNIAFKPFESDIRASGYAIEVDMATRNVRNYESVVLSCMNSGRGFEIKSQIARLVSEQSNVSMLFKDDSRVRVTFVVEQNTQNRLVYIYINGVMCGVTQYPVNDNFSQRDAQNITIGAESCGLDLYRIRIYGKSLNSNEVVDNLIVDQPTLQKRNALYESNNILGDDETVSIDKLPNNLAYMVVSCAELPQSKGDKKTATITFVDHVDSSRSFVAENAVVDVQGTSSAKYPVKNLKIKMKNGFTTNGSTVSKYSLRPGDIPVNTFTIKVDYASSEGANNVDLVQLYEDISKELGILTPPQEEYDINIRKGIAGRPIALFWHDTVHNETTFIGKANFNNDKGTPETFGFDKYETAEAWDFRNNTSDICLFRSADFSGDAWQNDLEAIYPDESLDTTAVQRPFQFVSAHNRDTVSTNSEKEEMLADFKAHLSEYFAVDHLLFYYVFTECYLLMDNRAKNIHLATYDGIHWMPIPYDMDSSLGINNEGELVYEYYLEDTDSVGGDQVFTGQDSVLWNNLRDAYSSEITAMYKRMRSGTVFNYETTRDRFLNHQSAWPKRMWNEDSQIKYLTPYINDNKDYLAMLQGDKSSQRDWWLFYGFKYRDSKYDTGNATSKVITIRGYTDDSHPIANQSISLTAYSNVFGLVDYASSYKVKSRMSANETKVFTNPMSNMWDTEIYIHSADCLSDVGDLSPMNLGSADFSAASKLNRLILGSSASGYENNHLNALTVGNNELLTLLNVCNCKTLATSVDLTGCVSIETILATGSAITGVQLPIGGHLTRLELPATVTNLTVQNQLSLATFVMEGYTNLSTLRIENTPTIPLETVINAATNLARVRLMGIEWTATNESALTSMIDRLDTCQGLDDKNNTITNPVVSGRVNISTISSSLLIRIQNGYPDLVVVVNGHPQYVVHYVDYDGSTLYNQVIAEGGNATDPITGGQISTPTRPDDQDGTSYVFSSWTTLPTNVHANSTVTAQYTAAYKVRYVNSDGTVLQTNNVVHGQSTQYSGSTPTKGATAQYTYTFKEWSGADNTTSGKANGRIEQVTSARTVTATYTSTVRSYTATFYAEDRSTVLQTSTVQYGQSASYTGSTPVSADGYEFDGWEPANMVITANTNFYPKFKSPIEDAEISDTWDTIVASLEDGSYATKYKVGNYKPLDVGTEGTVNMQIVAMDDELGPMTFVAKELLVTNKAMNSSDTNANGYPATNVMKPYLDNTIFPLLPAVVRNAIAAVPVKSYDKTTGTDLTSNEKLRIPSAREIVGGNSYEQSGPAYTSIYKDIDSRKKNKYGQTSATVWFYRSAYPSNDTKFRCNNKGDLSNSPASSAFGVCLEFTLSAETISDSWSEIAAAVSNNTYKTKYKIGDTKRLDLGDEGNILMQIAAFDADELADGSGTAAITWVAKQLLVTFRKMNSSSTNANGYPATTVMKPWMDNTIFPKFPTAVKTEMQTVKKTSYDKTTGTDLTSNEKLCIPSGREVFGGSSYEQSGPVYSGIFQDANSRKRKVYGQTSATGWWLRSAYPSGDTFFRGVNGVGDATYYGANSSYGVCLSFFFGVTPTT